MSASQFFSIWPSRFSVWMRRQWIEYQKRAIECDIMLTEREIKERHIVIRELNKQLMNLGRIS